MSCLEHEYYGTRQHCKGQCTYLNSEFIHRGGRICMPCHKVHVLCIIYNNIQQQHGEVAMEVVA